MQSPTNFIKLIFVGSLKVVREVDFKNFTIFCYFFKMAFTRDATDATPLELEG